MMKTSLPSPPDAVSFEREAVVACRASEIVVAGGALDDGHVQLPLARALRRRRDEKA
jgi:hypothetical protein